MGRRKRKENRRWPSQPSWGHLLLSLCGLPTEQWEWAESFWLGGLGPRPKQLLVWRVVLEFWREEVAVSA